jgi:alanine dehydrogenase
VTLVLTRADVRALFDMDACISAVESAFRAHADGRTLVPSVLGTDSPPRGIFHVKVAGLRGAPAYYAAKVNANFPDNPRERSEPSIQGIIALFDADAGVPLAVMDSAEVTRLRTAAATAVAARHLALPDARAVTLIGCGAQGRAQLEALCRVRPIRRVFAFDISRDAAASLASEMSSSLGIPIEVVTDYRRALRESDVCITCTPSRQPLVAVSDAHSGLFIAAVGADNHDKQELDPRLVASATLVTDVTAQCAREGDLHHAIAAGLMTEADVHAELAQVVSGARAGRTSPDEVTIFDSTGTALEDVAAAAVVYERALSAGRGVRVTLLD